MAYRDRLFQHLDLLEYYQPWHLIQKSLFRMLSSVNVIFVFALWTKFVRRRLTKNFEGILKYNVSFNKSCRVINKVNHQQWF